MKKNNNKIIKGFFSFLHVQIFIIFLAIPAQAIDYVRFVDRNVLTAGDGQTLETAYGNISDALIWANTTGSAGDTNTIYVKAGIYDDTVEPGTPLSINGTTVDMISLIGDSNGKTVITPGVATSWTYGFSVTAKKALIKNFEINGFPEGIYVSSDSSQVDVSILDNTISGSGTGITGIQIWASQNSLTGEISGNIIHSVSDNGISVRSGMSAYNPDLNLRIVNNIIYNMTGSSMSKAISLYSENEVSGQFASQILFNTIDSSTNIMTSAISIGAAFTPPDFSTLISFNNITNFTANAINHTSPITSGDITEAYNNFFNSLANSITPDSTSDTIKADPGYIDISSGNFTTSTSSGCIDKLSAAQVASAGVITDFTGRTRPYVQIASATPYDIGAYEYSENDIIRYVDVDGDDNNDGKTSATAWKTFYNALSYIGNMRLGLNDTNTLHLAAGEYSIVNGDDDLPHQALADNLAIKGAGAGNTIIKGAGTGNWTTGLSIHNKNITITGMTFNNFAVGVHIGSSENVKVINCDFDSCSDGISIMPDVTGIEASPEISGNNITGYTNGVSITANTSTAAASPVIKENIFSSSTGSATAIYLHQYDYTCSPEIRRNTISNTSGVGSYGINVMITGGTSTPVIAENRLTGVSNCIYFYAVGTMSPQIFNNVMIDVPAADAAKCMNFELNSGSGSPMIYHNTLDGGGSSNTGMYFYVAEGSLTPDVKFNLVTRFLQYGIQNDSASPATITADAFVLNNAFGSDTNYQGTIPNLAANKSEDPLYAASDLSIPASSPCIDQISAADYNVTVRALIDENKFGDVVGTSRLRASNLAASASSDIGAYEYPYHKYDFTLPGGTGVAGDYRLLTLPIDMDGVTPIDSYTNLFGDYDNTVTRIFAYDNLGAKYVELPETAFEDLSVRGRSFWGISTGEPETQTFEGGLVGNTEPYVIQLTEGWNLISLPWPIAGANQYIELNEIKVDNGTIETTLAEPLQTLTDPCIWSYHPNVAGATANGYVKHDQPEYKLDIGIGYWLKVNVASVKITFPPLVTRPEVKKTKSFVDSGQDYEAPPAPPTSSGITAKGGNGCFIDTLF